MAAKGNYSNLPPIRDIAETLRDGDLDFDEICTMYGVVGTTLTNRLHAAGYAVTGNSLRVEARKTAPLRRDGEPSGPSIVSNAGGGDYVGLPIQVVPHTNRRRKFVGLDWTTSPASGPVWRWV